MKQGWIGVCNSSVRRCIIFFFFFLRGDFFIYERYSFLCQSKCRSFFFIISIPRIFIFIYRLIFFFSCFCLSALSLFSFHLSIFSLLGSLVFAYHTQYNIVYNISISEVLYSESPCNLIFGL